MQILMPVLGALATWRISHLISKEDGPGDIFSKMRLSARSRFWETLLSCFYCVSVWVAAPIAVFAGAGWKEQLLLWPALSGAAILLERATSRSDMPANGFYIEEMEGEHVLR